MKYTLAYIIHFTRNLPIHDLIYMHTLVEIEWASSFLYTLIKYDVTLESFYVHHANRRRAVIDKDTHFTQALSQLHMETARPCD